MSITDEDLQFMADAMWEDALLPGNGDLMFPQLPPADDPVEGAASLSDTLLEPRSNLVSKASKGKAKIEWKRSAKPVSGASTAAAATPRTEKKPTVATSKVGTKEKAKTGNANKENTKDTAQDKAKNNSKMPPPPSTSPLSDLYLSSLPASLARPRKNEKLNRSMKGASQNEKPAPGAAVTSEKYSLAKSVSAMDPYNMPFSPASNRPNHRNPAKKTMVTSPVTSVAKMTSPMGLIPTSSNKQLKVQKRVAKRSFLDPPVSPEIPEQETTAKAAEVKPPSKAPTKAPHGIAAPRQAAKSKRKPCAGKDKDKTMEKPEPRPTKAILKAEKQVIRSFLVPKIVKPEDEPYEVPASIAVDPNVEEVTKRLRPRVDKADVVISSDSETSYSDKYDCSDSAFVPATGDTTIMTTPDHTVGDFGTKRLGVARTSLATTGHVNGEQPAKKSRKRSVDYSVSEGVESFQSTKRHKKTEGLEVRKGWSELTNARGPETFVPEEDSGQQAVRQGKHQRSPAHMHGDGENQKREKPGRGRTAARGRSEEEAVTDHMPPESNSSSSQVVHSVAASDPFMGDLDEERSQQSQFTTKLLQSAVQSVSEVDHRGSQGHSRCSMASAAPRLAEGPMPVSAGTTAESSQIAREMMQLLSNSRQASAAAQRCGAASCTDIWLNETDPYKETSQVMGYVCKTLLRFLKSKESAVEDVATEYRQRSSAVLARMAKLHEKEKANFALKFEDKRQTALEAFEDACRGVCRLAGSLERVSLVPAVNDVLADSTVSRLRALQEEIA